MRKYSRPENHFNDIFSFKKVAGYIYSHYLLLISFALLLVIIFILIATIIFPA
ncbi:MAG TPA: hypothetical protein PLI56_00460 [Exilispira sp.]|nr:hypothetical protein [Exilispira sp.]HQJ41351.1 hypothetical protein [Exilispira sp.]HQM88594.1 hypothetical protein [Exilispira sp.]